jgi:signal peptidase I
MVTLKKIGGELVPLVIAVAVVFLVRTVAAEPYDVPTPSMVPTLMVGDTLVASKYAYGYSEFSSPIGKLPSFKGRLLERAPERGDVIVFRLPRDTSITYVKRVIGLPGDRLQVRDGRLYLNDVLVPRRALGEFTWESHGRTHIAQRYVETLPIANNPDGRDHEILETSDFDRYDNTEVFEVPPETYFMMGDNRDDSMDSRAPASADGVGFVPMENLVGRAEIVLFSRDLDESIWNIAAWPRTFSRFFTRVA